MTETVTVKLPPNFTYREFKPGQEVELDPHTVAAWIRNYKVKPEILDGAARVYALLPQEIQEDPTNNFDTEETSYADDEQVTYCLPDGVRWQDYKSGDTVTTDNATRLSLQRHAKKRIIVLEPVATGRKRSSATSSATQGTSGQSASTEGEK